MEGRSYENQLYALLEASLLVSAELELSPLLALLTKLAAKVVDAEAASLLLIDPAAQELEFAVALGEKGAEAARHRIKVGQGVAGWVAATGQSANVADAAADSRFTGLIDQETGFHTRNLLAVPMKYHDELVGVIESMNKRSGDGFSKDDQSVLEAFAAQAAVAVKNARYLELLQARLGEVNQEAVRQAEQARAGQHLLREVMNALADAVWVTDQAANVWDANPAADLLLRQRLGTSLGKPLGDLLGCEPVAELIKRFSAGEESPEAVEVKLTIEDEPCVLQLRAGKLPPVKTLVASYVFVATDITTLKDLAQMKSDFVGYVSHEMKTPLTNIIGFTSTLIRLKERLDSVQQEEFLTTIESEAHRLVRLINDFLDVTKLEAGKALTLIVTEENPERLTRKSLAPLEKLSDNHQLVWDFPESATSLECDADKVAQILVNLVSNAIKYSPNGGEIGIRLAQEGDCTRWQISDQGLGMTPEEQGLLFQQFSRLPQKGTRKIKGTGLGLYITRRLIEAHRGRIWVESTPGEGSTFSFELPNRATDTAK